jgi:hypothetical protein
LQHRKQKGSVALPGVDGNDIGATPHNQIDPAIAAKIPSGEPEIALAPGRIRHERLKAPIAFAHEYSGRSRSAEFAADCGQVWQSVGVKIGDEETCRLYPGPDSVAEHAIALSKEDHGRGGKRGIKVLNRQYSHVAGAVVIEVCDDSLAHSSGRVGKDVAGPERSVAIAKPNANLLGRLWGPGARWPWPISADQEIKLPVAIEIPGLNGIWGVEVANRAGRQERAVAAAESDAHDTRYITLAVAVEIANNKHT